MKEENQLPRNISAKDRERWIRIDVGFKILMNHSKRWYRKMKRLERENKTLKLELQEYKQVDQAPTPSRIDILAQEVQQDE